MHASRLRTVLSRGAVATAAICYGIKGAICEGPSVPHDPLESLLATVRPNPEEYESIPWNVKKNEEMIRNHALFDTLYGTDRVEAIEVYKHRTKQEVLAVLKFGTTLNGYPGILHGGVD